MFLKKEHINSDCAIGGETAIKMIKKRMKLGEKPRSNSQQAYTPYKLIFMDYSMPVMNGVETSLKIFDLFRKKGIDPNDPEKCPYICFLSAYSDTPYIEEARGIGINHYLFKPVDSKDINKLLY